MTRLLHDNITEGTGTAAYTGCLGQAGKTGTTDNETDALGLGHWWLHVGRRNLLRRRSA